MKLINLVESVKQKCVFKIYGAMAHKSNNAMKINKASKQTNKSILMLILISLIAVEPSIALAGGDTDFGNLGVVATNLISFLTGTFGRSVATIAVIALGIMAMFEKFPLAMRNAIEACRPHFYAAAGFSALVNLLYLAPTIYMMQVYDRVVPTGGVMTLVWITVVLALALGTLAVQQWAGSRLSGAAVSAPGPQASPVRNPALNRRAGDQAIKLGQILAADDRDHKSADLRRLGF